MFKCLRSGVASGAAGVRVLLEPRRMWGEIAFASPHLVDSASDKLVVANEGVWGEVGRAEVVRRVWKILRP